MKCKIDYHAAIYALIAIEGEGASFVRAYYDGCEFSSIDELAGYFERNGRKCDQLPTLADVVLYNMAPEDIDVDFSICTKVGAFYVIEAKRASETVAKGERFVVYIEYDSDKTRVLSQSDLKGLTFEKMYSPIDDPHYRDAALRLGFKKMYQGKI